jgi:HK97 family phage major capsid protein
MAARITKAVFETSAMRQVANVVSITSDSYDIIADNTEATSGGWVTEQGTRATSNTPTIGKKTITVHEQFAMPKATQKLLDDAGIDVEAWLADKIAEILTKTENTAFFTGSGVGQPRGILDYTAGTTWGTVEQISSTSGTAGTLAADDFISLFYSLKEPYQAGASFLMQRNTVKKARMLKETSTNNYIWAPGLQAKAPDTILGCPVVQCADMGVVTTTDALAVACGDFKKAYTIVDRIGIRTLRDPFTSKPFVQFYTTKRVGGDVENFEALKLLKMDA